MASGSRDAHGGALRRETESARCSRALTELAASVHEVAEEDDGARSARRNQIQASANFDPSRGIHDRRCSSAEKHFRM